MPAAVKALEDEPMGNTVCGVTLSPCLTFPDQPETFRSIDHLTVFNDRDGQALDFPFGHGLGTNSLKPLKTTPGFSSLAAALKGGRSAASRTRNRFLLPGMTGNDV